MFHSIFILIRSEIGKAGIEISIDTRSLQSPILAVRCIQRVHICIDTAGNSDRVVKDIGKDIGNWDSSVHQDVIYRARKP